MRSIRLLLPLLSFVTLAYSQASLPAAMPNPAKLYLKVQLDRSVKFSRLNPGDVLQGKVAEDVYSADQEVFAAGSTARLTVDHLAKRRRVPNDHWPWVIKAFSPRHEKYPVFSSATISTGSTESVPLQVSMISVMRMKDVHANANKASKRSGSADSNAKSGSNGAPSNDHTNQDKGPVVALEALVSTAAPNAAEATTVSLAPGTTLAAGTEAKILLLGSVSASGSHAGDQVEAKVIQPVRLNSQVVLPEGTLIEGTVVKSKAPRMLSRAGSLLVNFTGLKLPGAAPTPVAASITEAELDQRSHTRIDPEGQMLGERPGKAWLLIDAGVTSGIAKEADDGTQLVIEAIVSTATDASTAGVAKIAATCASAVFMLTRHGRDVVLPRFTELTIVFDRPVTLAPRTR